MFTGADFDMFGNIRTSGAMNPTGIAFQNYQPSQMMTSPNVGTNLGGVQIGGTPQIGGGNLGSSTPLGFNLGTGQLVLGGVQALGNLWAAWQAQQLAREQFDYQKGITNTNLANQIQSYNTALGDRINARAHMEGRPEGFADQYIEENRMRDRR